MSTLRTGARTPFFATDITYYFDLTGGDFSPINNAPIAFTDTQEDVYIKNGFVVANATDDAGLVYCITWEQYQTVRQQSNRSLVTNIQVIALCVPVAIYLASGDWTMTPVVKVFQTTEQAEYPSTIDYINIGTIR